MVSRMRAVAAEIGLQLLALGLCALVATCVAPIVLVRLITGRRV